MDATPHVMPLTYTERMTGIAVFLLALAAFAGAMAGEASFLFRRVAHLGIAAECRLGLPGAGLHAQWLAARFALYFLTGLVGLLALYAVWATTTEARSGVAAALAAIGLAIGCRAGFTPGALLQEFARPVSNFVEKGGLAASGYCSYIVDAVQTPRTVGHVAAGLVAGALSAALIFGRDLDRTRLLRRTELLKSLLLATSAFFVAGVLTARAAITLLLGLWQSSEKLSTDALLAGCVESTALTYSSVLLVFVLGTRWCVGHLAHRIAAHEGHQPGTEAYAKAVNELNLDGLLGNIGQAIAVAAPLAAGELVKLLG